MALSCDSHFLNKMGGQSYLPEVKRGRAWGRGCTRAQLGAAAVCTEQLLLQRHSGLGKGLKEQMAGFPEGWGSLGRV